MNNPETSWLVIYWPAEELLSRWVNNKTFNSKFNWTILTWCVPCILFVPPFFNQYLCTTICVLNHIDRLITEGTLMICKVVHLCLKKLRLYNKRSTDACKYLTCCEEFTVRLGFLKRVSVDSETCRMWFSVHSVVHKCWLINGSI